MPKEYDEEMFLMNNPEVDIVYKGQNIWYFERLFHMEWGLHFGDLSTAKAFADLLNLCVKNGINPNQE